MTVPMVLCHNAVMVFSGNGISGVHHSKGFEDACLAEIV